MSEGSKMTSTVLYSCTNADTSSCWQSGFRDMMTHHQSMLTAFGHILLFSVHRNAKVTLYSLGFPGLTF